MLHQGISLVNFFKLVKVRAILEKKTWRPKMTLKMKKFCIDKKNREI